MKCLVNVLCSSCEHGIQVVLRQLAEHHRLCWKIYHAQQAPTFDGVRLLVCTYVYLTKLSAGAVGGPAGRVWGRRHGAVLVDEVDECTLATLLAGTRKGAEVLAGYDPGQKLESELVTLRSQSWAGRRIFSRELSLSFPLHFELARAFFRSIPFADACCCRWRRQGDFGDFFVGWAQVCANFDASLRRGAIGSKDYLFWSLRILLCFTRIMGRLAIDFF